MKSLFSEIYCHGELLHTVQMAKLYKDSKTFVDMSMIKPPRQILNAFKEMMNKSDRKPTQSQVNIFVFFCIYVFSK